ncbi:MAG: tubulin-like doman-containing protein [Desulfosporosinus sp.]|nr:tubulin-like doman-containing protein [Desulfosporosinus sp.]
MRLAENLNQLRLNKSGITSDLSRVDAIPDPILVIGLGGTGVTALSKVKNAIYRRFNLPSDSATGHYKDKSENIEYLGLDTDEHIVYDDDKYSGRSIELNPSTEFLRIYTPAVPRMLANRAGLPHTITDWLSPNLSPNDFDQGANGIRQMGRLALFLRITDVVNMIERKLNSVLQGKKGNLYVFILSGVSGGTGGGTFIDIPYIVRCIAQQLGALDRLKTIGYLFLPDVNMKENKADFVQSNGFAALKELDYWMTDHGQPFVQEYTKNYSHSSVAAPYDYCYLISSIDKNNILLTDSKSNCMEIVSENLVHFISKGKVQNTTFTLPAFLSNLDQIKLNIFSGMKPPFQANYEYFILGASSYEIPIEQMMNYAAFILMERVNIIYENDPGSRDVGAFIEKLELGYEDLINRYFADDQSLLAGWQQNPHYSAENAGKIDLDGQLTKEMRVFLDHVQDSKSRYNAKQALRELKEKIRKELNQLFVNPEKGPIFVSRLLFSPDGDCVLRRIGQLRQDAEQEQKNKESERQIRKETGANLFSKTLPSLLNFSRKNNWEKYVQSKINEYKAALKAKVINDLILPMYEELADDLRGLNAGIYQVWVDILKQPHVVLKGNAEIVTSLNITKHAKVEFSTWSVLDPQDWVKKIGEMINEKSHEQILHITAEFLTDLQKNSVFWLDNQGKEAVRILSNFVSNMFSEIALKSLETYLQEKYGNLTFEDIVSLEIGPKLHSGSALIFHMDNTVTASLNDFPTHFTVSIPENCEKLHSAFLNYVEKAEVKGTPEQVASSEIKHSIYWVNTSIGVPLFAYSRLRSLETIYEYRAPNDPGIHLRDEWRAFPSPFPDKADPANRTERNRELRELFRRALENGIIVEDSKVKPKFTIKQLPPVTVQNRSRIFDLPIRLIPIFQSIDLESAEDNFLRVPSYAELVRRQLAEIEQVDLELKRLEKIKHEEKIKWERLNDLILALVSGTLYWAGPKLLYHNDPDEEAWSPLVDKLEHEDFYLIAFDTYRSKSERTIQKLIRTEKAKRNQMEASKIKQRLLELQEEFAGIKAHFDNKKLDGKAVDEKYLAFLKDALNRVNFLISVY